MTTTTPEQAERGRSGLPERPWSRPADEICDELGADAEAGLDADEAGRRRESFGPNRLRRHQTRSAWEVLVDQFKSIIVGLLAVATILALAFGEPVEAAAIGVVIVVNAAIGFVTEYRAVRSMDALRRLGSVEAVVRRGGEIRRIPAEDVVPGDLLVLEGGDVVTADARLVEATNLEVNEASLTGESVPVAKSTEAAPEEAPLAERSSMLHKGTAITSGSGEAVVAGTGMATELGHVSELVESADDDDTTPLQRRLQALGHRLLWLTLGVGVVVAVAGILAGRDVPIVVETAVALAVAAIPEGLPIVATVALARSMRQMAARQAVVERPDAVETLGSVGVILTDKTGTLTENEMVAARFALVDGDVEVTGGHGTEGDFEREGEPVSVEDDPVLRQALEVASLCNAVEMDEDAKETVGDPMEVALVRAAMKAGMGPATLSERLPLVREVGFDPDEKMMATYHRGDEGVVVLVKGAPAAVLDACSSEAGDEPFDDDRRRHWRDENERLASEGLRMLGLAMRQGGDEQEPPYADLTFLGLAGLVDPPREDVRESIQAARDGGVRVVMVTGDQVPTARWVGEALGMDIDEVVHGEDLPAADAEVSDDERRRLTEATIIARTSPEQKLDVIGLHQDAGDTVAMIGDGVNDAPALEKADIGVAMGRRGTQVAKEAADMVLEDDEFGTIVVAIRHGRVIFHNIRAFVLYLLSCNLSQILSVGVAAVLAVPLPVLPLQILYLNLVTDVFPALALGAGEGDPRLFERGPRPPGEPVMTSVHWALIGVYGAMMAAAVLATLWVATGPLGLATERAVTVTFLTLGFAQLWHVFNMAGPAAHPVRNEVTRNRWVWGAIVLCLVLLVGPLYIPLLADVLEVVVLAPAEWGLVVAGSLAPLLVAQVLRVPFLRDRVTV